MPQLDARENYGFAVGLARGACRPICRYGMEIPYGRVIPTEEGHGVLLIVYRGSASRLLGSEKVVTKVALPGGGPHYRGWSLTSDAARPIAAIDLSMCRRTRRREMPSALPMRSYVRPRDQSRKTITVSRGRRDAANRQISRSIGGTGLINLPSFGAVVIADLRDWLSWIPPFVGGAAGVPAS